MKAAFYIRMSTDKQENSIESQNDILFSYAKNNKIQVVQKYIDEGISGRTAEKRPAFMQMIEDSAKGLFDTVLVYDSSRFARNLEESIVYKSTLKRNGVRLVSITEPTLDDDSALLTDAMLGALNEMYSRKLSKTVKRGMTYAAQKGEHQTCPPLGYHKANGKMTIIEEEAKIVRQIFELFKELPSWRSVAIRLNDLGIKKRRGGLWASYDIKRILKNSTYIGEIKYCGGVYKGTHEPIIDADTWTKVKKIIDEKPSGKSRPEITYKHWLSGLLVCSYCGRKMTCKKGFKSNPTYRCGGNSPGRCKYTNSMSVPKLESLIKEALDDILDSDKIYTYKHITPKKDTKSDLETLKKSLDKVYQKLERHKAAYSNGIDTIEEYAENKEICTKEEKALLKQIAALTTTNISVEKVVEFKNTIGKVTEIIFSDEYTIEQKSIAIKTIISKIIFKNTGEFTVYYFL